jgi:hypothetical protein
MCWGNTAVFDYFQNNYTDALQHEQGKQGILLAP